MFGLRVNIVTRHWVQPHLMALLKSQATMPTQIRKPRTLVEVYPPCRQVNIEKGSRLALLLVLLLPTKALSIPSAQDCLTCAAIVYPPLKLDPCWTCSLLHSNHFWGYTLLHKTDYTTQTCSAYCSWSVLCTLTFPTNFLFRSPTLFCSNLTGAPLTSSHLAEAPPTADACMSQKPHLLI